ncbi:hypothetical protein DL93DRAFT_2228836 [Clavulina sp. PMI_390]|nr:hypothetical protein DL93DRAFT_2228836 [Clavulina sp. PMI_390]
MLPSSLNPAEQPELIVEILCESVISWADIVRFRGVCRLWRDTISTSTVLQYFVYLGVFHKVEVEKETTVVAGLSILHKIQALLAHENAWAKVQYRNFRTLSLTDQVESVTLAASGFLKIVSPDVGAHLDDKISMVLKQYSLPSAITSVGFGEVSHEPYDFAYYIGKNVLNDYVSPHNIHAGFNGDITIWSRHLERALGPRLEFCLRREAEPLETPIVVNTLDLLSHHSAGGLLIETTLAGQYLLVLIRARTEDMWRILWTHAFVWDVLTTELVTHLLLEDNININWVAPEIFVVEGIQESSPLVGYLEIYCPAETANPSLTTERASQAILSRRLMLPPFDRYYTADLGEITVCFETNSVLWGAQQPVFPVLRSKFRPGDIFPPFENDDGCSQLCAFSVGLVIPPNDESLDLEEYSFAFVIRATTLLSNYEGFEVPWEMWGAKNAACLYGESLRLAGSSLWTACGTRMTLLVQDEQQTMESADPIGWTIHVLDFNPAVVRRFGDIHAWPPKMEATQTGTPREDGNTHPEPSVPTLYGQKATSQSDLTNKLGNNGLDYISSCSTLHRGPFQIHPHDQLPTVPAFTPWPLQANLPFVSTKLNFRAKAQTTQISLDSEHLIVDRHVKRGDGDWERVLDILTF